MIIDLLTRLGGWKSGLTLMLITFLAGVGAQATFGEFSGHEERLEAVETWVDQHDDSVTIRVKAMVEEQDQVGDRLESIETLLSCMHYAINPCPEPAPRPPRRIP